MSGNIRETEAESDEREDLPLDELTESRWLRARETDPDAPPPSPALAREHEELEHLLGTLPPFPEEEGWQDEVLAAASRYQRRQTFIRWGAVAGGVLAAAAVAVLVFTTISSEPRSKLQVALKESDKSRGDSKRGKVNDLLVITARPGAGEAADLRVYRADGKLVARCPSGPRCVASAGAEQTINVTLDAPAKYDVILVIGPGLALPDGPMDTYLGAAQAARAAGKARIERIGPIEID